MTLRRLPSDIGDDQGVCGLRAMFLEGECYAFAIACHRLTGWPIVALRTAEHDIRHAAIRDGEGRLYDARGQVAEPAFGEPFGTVAPYDLRVITPEDLTGVRPVEDHVIAWATSLIEACWPEWVNAPGDLTKRFEAYVEALEALSRLHGVYVQGPSPGTPPRLVDAKGGGLVYCWQTNAMGSDRTLLIRSVGSNRQP